MSDQPTELARIIAVIDKLKEAKDEAEPWAMLSYLIELAMVEATDNFQSVVQRELDRTGGMN